MHAHTSTAILVLVLVCLLVLQLLLILLLVRLLLRLLVRLLLLVRLPLLLLVRQYAYSWRSVTRSLAFATEHGAPVLLCACARS